jgi:hypothetical protein
MTTEECREALRSQAPVVAVEAAAGCGKTFEAAALAVDLANHLADGQEVLLLAHTHAAINVFRERVAFRRRVRVMTLDAFAHELVEPYASALKLPVPLRLGRPDGLAFEMLAPALCTLLRRAPAIRKAVAQHYPVVLLDEHQDARSPQHEAAIELAGAGARIRFFGDPMQAIFDFGGSAAAEWSTLVQGADHVKTLVTPRRWPEAPRLGEWLAQARESLRASGSLPTLVPEVRCEPVDDREPSPKSKMPPQNVARRVFQLLDSLEGSVGLLVRNRAHAIGLRRALGRRIPLFEGRSALESAGLLLDRALAVAGNPQGLALLALGALGEVSAGVTDAFREQVARCLLPDAVDRRRQKKLLPLLEVLSPLYSAPSAVTWCAVVGALFDDPPPDVKLDDARALRLVGSLRAARDEELPGCLAELGHSLSHRRPRGRCIITIHMAKGDEFDHVIVPHFGSSNFPDSASGRRLLYVAATRARRSLHFLTPSESPSRLAPGQIETQRRDLVRRA